MDFQTFCKRTAGAASLAVVIVSGAFAQQSKQGPVMDRGTKKIDLAGSNNLYCAGYIQSSPLELSEKASDRASKIVGAYNEQDGRNYSQGNYLVIDGGEDKGVKVGDMYSIVRPRGEVGSKWSKKGKLGRYVQELGVLEVVSVKPEVSWARVRTSCDSLMAGDLLVPFQPRTSPVYERRGALDVFADPSGKPTGRIFMARDNYETLARDEIVYVDLGSEDKVTQGDYLTIFRPLGKGNIVANGTRETVSRRGDFASDTYNGVGFSNQAAGVGSSDVRGKELRKVVGEAVVLNVKERTATVVITRASQEIHTGDWVEVQ